MRGLWSTFLPTFNPFYTVSNHPINGFKPSGALQFVNSSTTIEYENYKKGMYVYMELDNLESAIESYRNGFVTAYTTSRTIMTFSTRCEGKEFLHLTKQLVDKGSFSPPAVNAVKRLIELIA